MPPPPPLQKERADRRAVNVQSHSLIFSEGESEISLGKSREEVKDGSKTKSWICSSLLPHNYLALSCVPFFLPSLPHLVLTSLTEQPPEPANHNLLPMQKKYINQNLVMNNI